MRVYSLLFRSDLAQLNPNHMYIEERKVQQPLEYLAHLMTGHRPHENQIAWTLAVTVIFLAFQSHLQSIVYHRSPVVSARRRNAYLLFNMIRQYTLIHDVSRANKSLKRVRGHTGDMAIRETAWAMACAYVTVPSTVDLIQSVGVFRVLSMVQRNRSTRVTSCLFFGGRGEASWGSKYNDILINLALDRDLNLLMLSFITYADIRHLFAPYEVADP